MTGTFEQWAIRMEGEYKRKKSERNRSFEQWFDSFNDLNQQLSKDYKKFEEANLAKDGRTRIHDNNLKSQFIAVKIAQEFYPDLIENEYTLKKGSIFSIENAYGNALKAAFLNGFSLNRLDRIINDDTESDNKNNTWHWVEICSALQKNYNIFTNISDINVFLTKVARQTSNKELRDYGLYVRDIYDLCIGFAILHGYSFEETKGLVTCCQAIIEDNQKETVNESTSNKSVTPLMLKTFDSVDVGLRKITEKQFLEKVNKYAKNFLPIGSKRHWSTYKYFLKLILGTDFIEGQNDDLYRNFNERLGQVYEYICGVLLSLDEHIEYIEKKKITSLKQYILSELKLTVEAAAQGELGESKDKFEESISWFRKVVIISNMKDIDNQAIDNKQIVLENINYALEKCNLRVISYEPDGNENIINTTTDLFDWFVIECLIRDQQCYVEEEDEGISGFKPFCDFLGIVAEDKEVF